MARGMARLMLKHTNLYKSGRLHPINGLFYLNTVSNLANRAILARGMARSRKGRKQPYLMPSLADHFVSSCPASANHF